MYIQVRWLLRPWTCNKLCGGQANVLVIIKAFNEKPLENLYFERGFYSYSCTLRLSMWFCYSFTQGRKTGSKGKINQQRFPAWNKPAMSSSIKLWLRSHIVPVSFNGLIQSFSLHVSFPFSTNFSTVIQSLLSLDISHVCVVHALACNFVTLLY